MPTSPVFRARARHRGRRRGGENAGLRAQLGNQLLEELALLVQGIGRLRQAHARAHEAAHISAVVLLQRQHRSARHEARAGKQGG